MVVYTGLAAWGVEFRFENSGFKGGGLRVPVRCTGVAVLGLGCNNWGQGCSKGPIRPWGF